MTLEQAIVTALVALASVVAAIAGAIKLRNGRRDSDPPRKAPPAAESSGGYAALGIHYPGDPNTVPALRADLDRLRAESDARLRAEVEALTERVATKDALTNLRVHVDDRFCLVEERLDFVRDELRALRKAIQ